VIAGEGCRQIEDMRKMYIMLTFETRCMKGKITLDSACAGFPQPNMEIHAPEPFILLHYGLAPEWRKIADDISGGTPHRLLANQHLDFAIMKCGIMLHDTQRPLLSSSSPFLRSRNAISLSAQFFARSDYFLNYFTHYLHHKGCAFFNDARPSRPVIL
jgi:hypothetical protein